MPYYPQTSSSGSGYPIYKVASTDSVDVPNGNENICTTIMVIDGVFQITGKATVL